MTDQKRPETLEEYAAHHLGQRIDAVVERLRHLADEVERAKAGLTRVGGPGRTSYAQTAAEVQHAVLWGVANLSLDGLATMAYDADTARVRRLAAEAIAAQIEARSDEVLARVSDDPIGRAGGAVIAVGALIAREYAVKEG